jgi:hypothetical protein
MCVVRLAEVVGMDEDRPAGHGAAGVPARRFPEPSIPRGNPEVLVPVKQAGCP